MATLMGGSHGARETLGFSPTELWVSQPHTPLASPFKVQRGVLRTDGLHLALALASLGGPG